MVSAREAGSTLRILGARLASDVACLVRLSMLTASIGCCVFASTAAQRTGDRVRASVLNSEAWTYGRLVRFDSLLVLHRSDRRVQLPRETLVRVQAYRPRNVVPFLALGAAVTLGGYSAARLIAGSDSRWACDGCGITWSESRDYVLFGVAGIALGGIARAIFPGRWKDIFPH